MMTLEEAMATSVKNSAVRFPSSGGSEIVDGVATRKNPHYTEDNYWVQQPFRVARQHYSSLDEVKKVVGANEDDWQPYEGE